MTECNENTVNVETSIDNFVEDKNFDYDGFWKSLIDRFCYPLLKRAVPELYEKADTTKAHRSLNVEYRNILNKEGKIVYLYLGEREAAKELIQRGREEGVEKVAKKLIERGDYSYETISEIAGLPVERVRDLVN